MGNLSPLLVIIGIFAAIGAVLFGQHLYEKQRTASLQQLANSLGLPFFAQGDSALVQTLSRFHLFSQGRARKIWNMLHGETADVDVAIFDYRYTVGSGKHQRTTKQTVIYFESQLLALPEFALRPESLFHKLGKIVGFQDINFESHPRFSSLFLVQSTTADRVRELFGSELLDWFERHSGVSCEGHGTRLLFYRAGSRSPAKEVRQLMKLGFELHELLQSAE